MVGAAVSRIALLVARASPAAFKAIDATCKALETEIGEVAADAASSQNEKALRAFIALKAACEVRKALKGRRK
jgi:hypothetical protein